MTKITTNPIDKNATLSLDQRGVANYITREDAQQAAQRMNLTDFEVNLIHLRGKKFYQLTWKTFK